MEHDLHELAYKSYMEDSENHFHNRDTYISGFKAGYQKAIQVQAGVMQKATVIIWVTYNEYGELEREFIYPETEENKMPYACEKYLMYNKDKTAKRLSCFSL